MDVLASYPGRYGLGVTAWVRGLDILKLEKNDASEVLLAKELDGYERPVESKEFVQGRDVSTYLQSQPSLLYPAFLGKACNTYVCR